MASQIVVLKGHVEDQSAALLENLRGAADTVREHDAQQNALGTAASIRIGDSLLQAQQRISESLSMIKYLLAARACHLDTRTNQPSVSAWAIPGSGAISIDCGEVWCAKMSQIRPGAVGVTTPLGDASLTPEAVWAQLAQGHPNAPQELASALARGFAREACFPRILQDPDRALHCVSYTQHLAWATNRIGQVLAWKPSLSQSVPSGPCPVVQASGLPRARSFVCKVVSSPTHTLAMTSTGSLHAAACHSLHRPSVHSDLPLWQPTFHPCRLSLSAGAGAPHVRDIAATTVQALGGASTPGIGIFLALTASACRSLLVAAYELPGTQTDLGLRPGAGHARTRADTEPASAGSPSLASSPPGSSLGAQQPRIIPASRQRPSSASGAAQNRQPSGPRGPWTFFLVDVEPQAGLPDLAEVRPGPWVQVATSPEGDVVLQDVQHGLWFVSRASLAACARRMSACTDGPSRFAVHARCLAYPNAPWQSDSDQDILYHQGRGACWPAITQFAVAGEHVVACTACGCVLHWDTTKPCSGTIIHPGMDASGAFPTAWLPAHGVSVLATSPPLLLAHHTAYSHSSGSENHFVLKPAPCIELDMHGARAEGSLAGGPTPSAVASPLSPDSPRSRSRVPESVHAARDGASALALPALRLDFGVTGLRTWSDWVALVKSGTGLQWMQHRALTPGTPEGARVAEQVTLARELLKQACVQQSLRWEVWRCMLQLFSDAPWLLGGHLAPPAPQPAGQPSQQGRALSSHSQRRLFCRHQPSIHPPSVAAALHVRDKADFDALLQSAQAEAPGSQTHAAEPSPAQCARRRERSSSFAGTGTSGSGSTPSSVAPETALVELIQRDVVRTLRGCGIFDDRSCPLHEQLRHVLLAFAAADTDTGYAQGLSYLASACCLVAPDAVGSLQLLLALTRQPTLLALLRADGKMLERHCAVFSEALHCLLPHLALHFRREAFDCKLFLFGWFTTLFLRALPLHIAMPCVDAFLVNGAPALYAATLALLQLLQPSLLQGDFDHISQVLTVSPGTVTAGRLSTCIQRAPPSSGAVPSPHTACLGQLPAGPLSDGGGHASSATSGSAVVDAWSVVTPDALLESMHRVTLPAHVKLALAAVELHQDPSPLLAAAGGSAQPSEPSATVEESDVSLMLDTLLG